MRCLSYGVTGNGAGGSMPLMGFATSWERAYRAMFLKHSDLFARGSPSTVLRLAIFVDLVDGLDQSGAIGEHLHVVSIRIFQHVCSYTDSPLKILCTLLRVVLGCRIPTPFDPVACFVPI